jgi:hypothetical protein
VSDPAGFRPPPRRPWTVDAAAWVTMVSCGLTLLVFLAGFVAAGLGRGGVVGDERAALDVVLGVSAVGTVWCVATIVLAWAALRRSRVARLLVIVSAALSVLVNVVTGFFLFVPFVLAAAGIAAVVLFLVGGAGEWYGRDDERASLPLGTTQPWG